jgi:hypothetical protein
MLQDGIEPHPVILLLIDDIQGFGNPFLLIVLQERTYGPLEELATGDAEPLGKPLGRIEEGVRYRDGGLHKEKYNKSYTIVKFLFAASSRKGTA